MPLETTGYLGYRSRLIINGTAVGQTYDLEGPDFTCPGVDITNNDSPDETIETMQSLKKYEPFRCKLLYRKDYHGFLMALAKSRETINCVEEYPDGSGHDWLGFISKLSQAAPTQDKMSAELEITNRAGDPTFFGD